MVSDSSIEDCYVVRSVKVFMPGNYGMILDSLWRQIRDSDCKVVTTRVDINLECGMMMEVIGKAHRDPHIGFEAKRLGDAAVKAGVCTEFYIFAGDNLSHYK